MRNVICRLEMLMYALIKKLDWLEKSTCFMIREGQVKDNININMRNYLNDLCRQRLRSQSVKQCATNATLMNLHQLFTLIIDH